MGDNVKKNENQNENKKIVGGTGLMMLQLKNKINKKLLDHFELLPIQKLDVILLIHFILS